MAKKRESKSGVERDGVKERNEDDRNEMYTVHV